MIKDNKVLVVDVDGTLTLGVRDDQGYEFAIVCESMRSKLVQLKLEGFWIVLYTSRNMRTHNGNIGAIIKNTAPVLINWLNKNSIPFDELHFGKPWCGNDGFYIDDRAIRPKEFIENSFDQIQALIERDRLIS